MEVATGRRWTWAELRTAVDEVAAGLLAAGIRKGDRVAIWAPNCAEWTLVQFATATVGAILVTVNPAYRTHELRYVLEKVAVQPALRRDLRVRELLWLVRRAKGLPRAR